MEMMETWEVSKVIFLSEGFIAIIFIVFGILAYAVIPRKPNWIMGYRTKRALKNQDTWVFAHKHFGKQMIIFGLVYVALLITRFFLFDNDASTWIYWVIVAAQVVSVLLALIPTEIALRKKFDKDGNRKGGSNSGI